MRISQSQYRYEARANNWWTIVEHTDQGDVDYECEFESLREAMCALQYIKNLEAVYSQPRE